MQICINWWVGNKMWHIHTTNYYLAGYKETNSWYTCYNMYQLQKHYAKWEQPDTKNYILYDLISMRFPYTGPIYIDRNQIVVTCSCKWKQGMTADWQRIFFRLIEMLWNVVVMVAQQYKFIKRIVCLQIINFIIYKLYLKNMLELLKQ